jgi:glycosyltransferase involved in cell wall biosynthesis
MRICHVTPHLPPDQAANALLPAELASWARRAGHSVAMVSHEPAQGRAASAVSDDQTWRLPRKRPSTGLSAALRIESLRQARRIRQALDEAARTADLLHLHSNGLIVEVAAAWASAKRIPFVLTLSGTEIWHFRRRWPVDPFARAYRHAGVVTFYSRKLLEKSTELGLLHPRREVVYPAIGSAFSPRDDATRAEWRNALGIAERRVILNVKRLHELAGQEYLIDAFARIARNRHDVRLVICGTGPLREALQTRARDRGIGDRVTFTGLIDNDIVARYAAVADVFALPSLLEALPTVAVEALASGTPVVSADHPGGIELHEIFQNDVTTVPKANVELLADALQAVLDDSRRVSSSTLDRVGQLFSAEAVTKKYEALYNELTGRSSGL